MTIHFTRLRLLFCSAVVLSVKCPSFMFVANTAVNAQRPAGRPPSSLMTCPAPIFGKFGRFRAGSCSCSFGFGIVRLSCSHITRATLQALLDTVEQDKVDSLKIENSDIGQLPPLDNMKSQLKEFRCRNCNLRGAQLPCNTFRGFKQLHLIDLSDNPLEVICSTLLTNAFKLDEALPDLPAIVAPSPAVTKKPNIKLNLSNTRLGQIPINLFNGDGLEQVVALDFSGNKLTTPLEAGVFSKMTGLQDISMSRMNLIDFQDAWFLPHSDGEVVEKEVMPEKRQQAVIGESKQTPEDEEAELPAAAKIRQLNLSHNLIRNLRVKDLSLFESSLEALDLSYNRLRILPNYLLAGFDRLTDVNLAHNQLKTVRNGLFSKSSSLSALSLANNHELLALPSGLFSSIAGLKQLSLAFLPKLSKLSEELFTRKTTQAKPISVDVLDLRGTQLRNKAAILQLTQALEGVVVIKVVVDTGH